MKWRRSRIIGSELSADYGLEMRPKYSVAEYKAGCYHAIPMKIKRGTNRETGNQEQKLFMGDFP